MQQTLTKCFLYHFRAILKISSKSVHNVLNNVAQTNKQPNQHQPKHNLLGESKKATKHKESKDKKKDQQSPVLFVPLFVHANLELL